MTPESWRRVGELFHQALDVATGERRAWVESACDGDADLLREVNSLLQNDQEARAFVQDQVRAGVRHFVDAERTRRAPERVGPYRLIREIGRGGMGTVYLAERDDDQYQIKAAIKLVTPGMDTDFVLQRFRRERQILARLDHPNIARLLDGGTTAEGLPYIVMEYVAGRRISEYCREARLTTGQILTLFLNVCAAVAHAHRHFIVHRDIKPGNILVTSDGVAKLLDFGICKLLHSEPVRAGDTLAEGGRLMTPDYAAPEQIRGEPVTIAADVYALAGVLYELLTGRTPHRLNNLSFLEVERAICEQEITRPSAAGQDPAIAKRLRGDLDAILLQALDKDPQRRYPTVTQFADDIRRHLNKLPVQAHQPRLSYRLRKLAARHAAAFTAAAIIAVLLAAGAVFSVRQTRLAQLKLRNAGALASTFLFNVDDAIRNLPGAAPAREIIVRAGLNYLDGLAPAAENDPQLQAELAHAYLRLGAKQDELNGTDLAHDRAVTNFEKARRLLLPAISRDSANLSAAIDRIEVAKHLSEHYSARRDVAMARTELEEGIRVGEAALRAHPTEEELRRRLSEVSDALSALR